jgi:hypothetical protein
MTGDTCYHYLNSVCPICGKSVSPYDYDIVGDVVRMKVHHNCVKR